METTQRRRRDRTNELGAQSRNAGAAGAFKNHLAASVLRFIHGLKGPRLVELSAAQIRAHYAESQSPAVEAALDELLITGAAEIRARGLRRRGHRRGYVYIVSPAGAVILERELGQ